MASPPPQITGRGTSTVDTAIAKEENPTSNDTEFFEEESSKESFFLTSNAEDGVGFAEVDDFLSHTTSREYVDALVAKFVCGLGYEVDLAFGVAVLTYVAMFA